MNKSFTFLNWILLATLSLLTSTTQAQTRQFHDTIYTVPADWNTGARSVGRAFLQSKKDSWKIISVLPTQGMPTSNAKLLKWMDLQLENTLPTYDRKANASPKKDIVQKRGDVTERFSFRVANGNLRIAYLHIGKQRANLVVYQARRPYRQALDVEMENEYTQTFLPFCRNLNFVSQGAKPLLDTPTPGKLSGIYYEDSAQLNHFFSSNAGIVVAFSKAGYFYAGLPRNTSAKDLDFEKIIQQMPSSAGNYVINDDKISFHFANGVTKTEKFKLGKNEFNLGTASLYRLATVPKTGSRLAGVWHDERNSMIDANERMRGGFGMPKKIELTKNGQYKATQFYGYQKDDAGMLNDVVGRLKPTKIHPASAGTYIIKDGTIEFTDSNGNLTRLSLVYVNENLLIIGGRRYRSRGKRGFSGALRSAMRSNLNPV